MNSHSGLKFLIYGASGFIGNEVISSLCKVNYNYYVGVSRIDKYEDVHNDIITQKPTHVICCAGLKGDPNVDWFDKPENYDYGHKINVEAQIKMLEMCLECNIHCTLISSGFVYNYDEAHQIGGKGFKEEAPQNYSKIQYARLRIELEEKTALFQEKFLLLRFNLVASRKNKPSNFLSKCLKYSKVHTIPSSISILEDLCPFLIEMCVKNITGLYNFTNPGAISLHEILLIYKNTIDPNHNWEVTTSGPENRPACLLDTQKLELLFPNLIPDINDTIKNIYLSWKV